MKVARKLRKLARSPDRFFYDMFARRIRDRKRKQPAALEFGRLSDGLDFSVVVAVYNAAPYLGEFFESLVAQTVGFEQRIELIMVDDGSADDSAAVVEQWRSKYPGNIRLVRKSNGGQASARNAGFPFVRGKWVTYIDPDDWVSPEYFAYVDDFLARSGSRVAAVCCNQVYYREAHRVVRNSHPLRDRFNKVERTVDLRDQPSFFNLQTANTFLRVDEIRRWNLQVDETCKPTFEDAKFFNEYLLACGNYQVAFLSRPKYYYRKRVTQDSSVDQAWRKIEQFSTKFERGYLPLLESYRRVHGSVPQFIQAMILYEMSWYIDFLIGRDDAIEFMTDAESAKLEELLCSVFQRTDLSVLELYSRMRPMYRYGACCRFAGVCPWPQEAYLQPRILDGRTVEIRFYLPAGDSRPLQVEFDGAPAAMRYEKTIVRSVNRRPFVVERRLFVDWTDKAAALQVKLGDVPLVLYAGRHLTRSLRFDALEAMTDRRPSEPTSSARLLVSVARSAPIRARYQRAWLLMDRDVQADDNAEHMYRWLRDNTAEGARCFFVLRDTSHDWARLQAEGFKLIRYGSLEHKLALLNAEWVISSHIDAYVHSPLPRNEYADDLKYKVAFLQHGVIKDDLSSWLSTPYLDVFVTTTEPEYRSVVQGNYPYTEREVVRSGLPRHDALLRKAAAVTRPDIVLIMPTWRQYLLGPTTNRGNERSRLEWFRQSAYYRSWQQVLSSELLVQEARAQGLEVVFFPHANMAPYLADFEPAKGVRVAGHHDSSIQDLLVRAAVMVTDFSSVAFEVALLRRPVLYFQFDRANVMADHISRPGYYDYHRDGFGPVLTDPEQLEAELIGSIRESCVMKQPYRGRADAAFDLADGQAARRVYEALMVRNGLRPMEAGRSAGGVRFTDRSSDAAESDDWTAAASGQ